MRANLASKLLTFWRIGLGACVSVIFYRFALKTGVHPVCRIRSVVPAGEMFLENNDTALSAQHHRALPAPSPAPLMFGHMALDDPRLTDAAAATAATNDLPWWQIPDFTSEIGDIKLVWEPSRLDEVVYLAQLYACQKDKASLAKLNMLILGWANNNVPYRGANWKCAQEASLRILNLATAALVLGDKVKPGPGLADFIKMHMQRIAPTTSYASAQRNNHITSEGGNWLSMLGVPEGTVWAQKGRRILNRQCRILVGEDGGFSQYSTNYHRLFLDSMSLVDIWADHAAVKKPGEDWWSACQKATQWLGHHVIADQGRAPSLGSNDGAKILRLGPASIDDYRPSVQLASVLFLERPFFPSTGSNNDYLGWLGLSSEKPAEGPSRLFVADETGFLVARQERVTIFLRYPRFKFRPGQSDLLHLGLWADRSEILGDAGTYSYASRGGDGFKGVRCHNSIEFDDRDQMPHISRFLYGSWPSSNVTLPAAFTDSEFTFGVEYRDFRGALHHRRVCLKRESLEVTDSIEGFCKSATIGWNLPNQTFTVERCRQGVVLISDGGPLKSMMIKTTGHMIDAGLVQRQVAPHYLERRSCQRLEITVSKAATLTTRIEW